ncbi:MAG: hypothetical protein P9X22_07135, partial [Candidatus Zapsychrus exili]|nr:hypothetical protein [Candidatus Zapsychrus exili]
KKESILKFFDVNGKEKEIKLPKNVYAFNLLENTLVVYHNPKRKDTFGKGAAEIKEIRLKYFTKKVVTIKSQSIPEPYSKDVRNKKLEQIDVYLG